MNEITLFLECLALELNIAEANIVEIYDDYREHCIFAHPNQGHESWR